MKKSTHVSILDLYMLTICIFPVITILADDGILNKLLFAVLAGLQLILMFLRPVKKSTILLLLVLMMNFVLAMYSTTFPPENVNLLLYFPFFMLYTYFFCDNQAAILDWFREHRQLVNGIILLWSGVVGISIFMPGCYAAKEGGNLFFGSFCGSIFRLGPAAVLIQVMAITLILQNRQKSAILYMIIPMYCFFMGSSRTYLVVGLCLFMVAWYIVCEKRAMFWLTAIPVGLLMLYMVAQTAIGDKIEYTLDEEQYGDFWFRITSSRSEFWLVDLTVWSESSLFERLFGCGVEMTIEETGLWAHNDFIELLCSFGVVGLAQYLFAIGRLYRLSYRRNRLPVIVKVGTFLVWLFNAFFNMHYVYFCAMLSYPILTMALGEYYEKNPVMPKPRRYRLVWGQWGRR